MGIDVEEVGSIVAIIITIPIQEHLEHLHVALEEVDVLEADALEGEAVGAADVLVAADVVAAVDVVDY